MSEKYELRVNIDYDESKLKALDTAIDNFRKEAKDLKINPTKDLTEVKKAIDSFSKYAKEAFNIKINPELNITQLKKRADEIKKYIKDATKASDFGFDVAGAVNGKTKNGMSKELQSINSEAEVLRQTFNALGMDIANFNFANVSEAKDSLIEYGKQNNIVFENMSKDSIVYRTNIDNIAHSMTECTKDATHFGEVVRDVPQAFTIVEGSVESLKRTMSQDNQKNFFDTIANSMKDAGLSLDKVDGDVSKVIRNIRSQFDQDGKLISATVRSIIDDIEHISRLSVNEEGGLSVQSSSINDRTKQANIQRINELINTQIASQKALLQAESAGKQNLVADIQQRMNARSQEIAQIREQIEDVFALEDADKKYRESMNTIEAGDADKKNAENLKELKSLYTENIAISEKLWKSQRDGSKETASEMQGLLAENQNLIEQQRQRIVDTNALKAAEEDYQKTLRQKVANRADKDSAKADDKQAKDIDSYLSKLEKYQGKINKLANEGLYNDVSIDGYKQSIEGIIKELDHLGITYDAMTNKFGGNLIDPNAFLSTSNSIDKVTDRFEAFKVKTKEVENLQLDLVDREKIQRASNLLDELNSKVKELAVAQSKEMPQSYIDRLKQDILSLAQSLDVAENDVDSFGRKIGTLAEYTDKASAEAKSTADSIDKIRSSADRAGDGIQKLGMGLDSMLASGFKMAAGFYIFNRLDDLIMNAANSVKELDKQMTSLQMVTEQSDTTILNMMSNYADMARELGVTMSSVAEGSAEWLKLGHYKSF